MMKCFFKYKFTEGLLLVTCNYDYMSTNWKSMSFLFYAFIENYTAPLVVLIYFYILIVKAAVEQEQHLRKAAQLMNKRKDDENA